MKRDDYDKQLIQWVKKHYWDSLEKDKDLILRHLRTFVGDINTSQPAVQSDGIKQCECGGYIDLNGVHQPCRAISHF